MYSRYSAAMRERFSAWLMSRYNRARLLGGDQEGRKPIVSDEEHRERTDALRIVEKPGKTFAVSSIDLQTAKNRKAHHTDEYELEGLILRRGQKFNVSITADRKISKEHDILVLQFVTGARPQESKGTIIRIPVNVKDVGSKASDATKTWYSVAQSVEEKKVDVEVTPPPDAIIGKYSLFVETKIRDSEEALKRHEHKEEIYVLFNAWCKEDTVYMEDDTLREEYVLNETGRIWVGSAWSNYGKAWNFGQLDSPCLEVAVFLMDKAELADSARCAVVSVVRTISEWANSCGDGTGVLEGNWGKPEDYPKDCTRPLAWTGSVAILEEYWKTKKAVKYGQCWVFSGIVTTLCRALGIPTRSVTNFESAHDSDCSMTIDFHIDQDGDPIEWRNDSVWNFHVWNESWFRRLDLPEGYDGWQVHDGTPQETSEGIMRCGPAPIKAIKEGQVYLSYDVGFIFAEVQGDKVTWEVGPGEMTVANIDKHAVGKRISTKAAGHKFMREDLTDHYKYPDGSAEERKVVKFVNRYSTRRKQNIYDLDHTPDIEYSTNLPSSTLIGEDFQIEVFLVNIATEDRTVKVRLTLLSAYYTGVAGRRIKGETHEMVIKAGEKKTVTIAVDNKEYVKLMNSSGLFQIFGTCRVQETNRVMAKQDSFSLKKPTLTIEAPDEIPIMESTKAIVHFKNTTNLRLHNGVFHIEAARMAPPKTVHIKKTVEPNEEVSAEITLTPKRWARGRKEIVATFSSDEVSEIEGSLEVLIVEKPAPMEED